jgi:hypothetical protein
VVLLRVGEELLRSRTDHLAQSKWVRIAIMKLAKFYSFLVAAAVVSARSLQHVGKKSVNEPRLLPRYDPSAALPSFERRVESKYANNVTDSELDTDQDPRAFLTMSRICRERYRYPIC